MSLREQLLKEKLIITFFRIGFLILVLTGLFLIKGTKESTPDLELNERAASIYLVDDAYVEGYVIEDEIRKVDLRIQNGDKKANVRWKAEVLARKGKTINIHNELIGVSDEWVIAKDGYYYSKESINPREEVKMFESVQMSAELIDNMQNDKVIAIMVTVNAVQCERFDINPYTTKIVMQFKKR